MKEVQQNSRKNLPTKKERQWTAYREVSTGVVAVRCEGALLGSDGGLAHGTVVRQLREIPVDREIVQICKGCTTKKRLRTSGFLGGKAPIDSPPML
jgi:hypothetical protein